MQTTTTTTTTPPAASSWPTPETTGVVDAAVLTPWTGSCDLHTAGQVIENKVFDCGLDVYVSGVTIRNSVIRGNEYHGVDSRAATGAPLVLEDVTFQPASGCWPYATAVGAQNLRATRVEITGFGDAFGASGNNVVFRDSYAKLCAPIGTEAHSDGFQGYLATAATSDRPNVLDHNTFDQRCHDWTWVDGWHYEGAGNQADQACEVTANVFWSDDSGDGLVVTDNLFRGGGFTIRVHTGAGHTVRGNVVERDSYSYGPVSSHCASIAWTATASPTSPSPASRPTSRRSPAPTTSDRSEDDGHHGIKILMP